jgi:hypothetical protein
VHARLVDYGGYEMFAMTPLKANTGWIRREMWKKRESPDITVVKGSIHDNTTLNQAAKDRFLNGAARICGVGPVSSVTSLTSAA